MSLDTRRHVSGRSTVHSHWEKIATATDTFLMDSVTEIGIPGTATARMIVLLVFGSIYSVMGTLMVAQLVEALRYKPEGRSFDSR
jgi:hypothetical protein